MSVEQMAYKGTSIVGFAANRAPHPSCCGDPRYLCANCARLALDEAGIVANCGDRRSMVLNENEFDPDSDHLEVPTINDLLDGDIKYVPRRQRSVVLNRRREFDPNSERLELPSADDLLDDEDVRNSAGAFPPSTLFW